MPSTKSTDRLITARRLRDKAIQLIDTHGKWEDTNAGKVKTCDLEGFTILLTTPFQRVTINPQINGALYNLNIWAPGKSKAFNIEWNDDSGYFEIVLFKRGDWERSLLSVAID